jgi:hypothetical protein
LRRWNRVGARAPPLLSRNTPLDMVFGRVEKDTVFLRPPTAVGEFGRSFPPLPTHFSIVYQHKFKID